MCVSALENGKKLKKILVTGGNKGIGKAICERLLSEWNDTFVILGSRNKERGEEAIADIRSKIGSDQCKDRISLLVVDTSDNSSVELAAKQYASQYIDNPELYGIINNAGIMDNSHERTINTNYFGPRRVNDAFSKFLKQAGGRIVNVSSALGPKCLEELHDTDPIKTSLMKPWLLPGGVADIDALARSLSSGKFDVDAYGVSKALLNAYTTVHQKLEPMLIINSCTPGYISTDLDDTSDATNPPSKGAIPPCWLMMDSLFVPTVPGGRYYGSDCVRSPLHCYRGPGDNPYIDDTDLVELPESAKTKSNRAPLFHC